MIVINYQSYQLKTLLVTMMVLTIKDNNYDSYLLSKLITIYDRHLLSNFIIMVVINYIKDINCEFK